MLDPCSNGYFTCHEKSNGRLLVTFIPDGARDTKHLSIFVHGSEFLYVVVIGVVDAFSHIATIGDCCLFVRPTCELHDMLP